MVWQKAIDPDLPYTLAEAALANLIRTNKFPPTLAEISDEADRVYRQGRGRRIELEQRIEREVDDAWYEANQKEIEAASEWSRRESLKLIKAWNRRSA